MNKRILSYLLLASLALSLTVGIVPVGVAATGVELIDPIDQFIAAQKALLDEPDIKYWPGTRWWMAEGLHTDQTIIDGVKEIHDMGLGLIEIVCRGGGARVPTDLDTSIWPSNTTAAQLYSWGSEEWEHDTKLLINEATKYGMGFSMTSGTNWSNANIPVAFLRPDDDGAGKSLGYIIQTVTGGARFNGTLSRSAKSGSAVTRQDLVAVVAMKRDSSSDATIASGVISMNNNFPERVMVYDDSATQVLTSQVRRGGVPVTAETMKDPTGAAAFTLDWTPPDNGTWDIFNFWIQATGQTATPSATTNYTINYIDPYGMDAYIAYYTDNFFTPELKEVIRRNGRGEMYMDSLEVSTTNGQTGQFWGYTFMDMFQDRHGYDLTPYLPYIIRTGSRAEYTKYHTKMLGSNGVQEAKIRADVYAVMTDCYVDNVLIPLKNWLNDELNMKLRAEIAYNLPYELSLSARGVDYVEAESLDFGEQIENFRGFAGGANVYGRRVSSETGALSGQCYAHGLERYMRMVNTQFAGGIQYTVWHGYSSLQGVKPTNTNQWTATYWPGTDIMGSGFGERFGPRQPAFGHYGDMMTKIARDQTVLQQGKAQVDLAILHTDYYTVHDYVGSAPDVDLMRNRKANFIKDLSLQDSGYTYNFLAPENLELLEQEGIVDYREGEGLIPDNVGYQAAIVYQENMRVESAAKLLDLAKKGLPIIFVNGLNVRHMLTKGTNNWGQAVGLSSPVAGTASPALWSVSKIHEQAAAYTLGLGEDEATLIGIIAQLKALPNVVELSPEGLPTDANNPDPEGWGYDDEYFYNKTGLLDALQDLGIRPRAEFAEPNKNYFTVTRKTDDTLYLWVYNFMSDDEFKPQMVTFDIVDDINISVSETGKPYIINTWTGEISELGAYTIEDGRISLDLNLKPGETTIIALDLSKPNGDKTYIVSTDADKVLQKNGALSIYATESGTYTTVLSNGAVEVNEILAPANINLTEWELTVEDWNRGDLVDITENRGLGYTTVEAYWTTRKTPINVGKTALIPWRNIPSVGPLVSGVGTYTTTFVLPSDWSDANGAYLDIESLCRNSAYVWVNGQRATGLDFVTGAVDVSDLLKPGENSIKVEVASTLRNRMINLGYSGVNNSSTYLPPVGTAYTGPAAGGRYNMRMPVADYGMVGDVTLVTYTVASVQSSVLADIRAEDANVIVNTPVSYTVSLEEAKGVGAVEVSFMFDGYVLDKDSVAVTPLNGFTQGVFPGLSFEYIESGIWKGTVKYMCPGYVQDDGPLDVLKISGKVISQNPATVTLTGFSASGDDGAGVGPMPGQIRTAAATVTVGGKPPEYSKYDLNKDSVIDETDLLYLIYFYQWNDRDPGWASDGLYGVFAKDCDFQVNGKVDLADMIELTANYGPYDPYAW